MADETYQSLYRRYRPGRFSEVLGQDHVTLALRNAVREGKVSQGYLFSGPRGTGKTSTARILGKALNCEALDDGEPCGVCESCTTVAGGNSFAVIEMDAASNGKVEDIRDLVSRAALGTTGLRKVYIIDEVHMLTQQASNALLKTLEEPPAHVVFVLATTDPQKMLPTIISRVQHFQFHLLAADTLGGLVRSINADAGLGLGDADLDKVVRRGSGSARDALSVLDQAAALGGTEDEVPVAAEVLKALVDRDPARALTAVAEGCAAGRDPRRLAEEILASLRDVFLAGRAPALVDLPPNEVERVTEVSRALGPAALVRAMETMGEALTEMRDALDPRVTLEVALVRVTAPEADASPAALLERIERLERAQASGGVGPGGVGDSGQRTASVPEVTGPPVQAPPPEVTGPRATPPAAPADRGQPGPHNLPRVPPERQTAPRPAIAPTTTVSAPPPPPGGRALGSYRGSPRSAPEPAVAPASGSVPSTEVSPAEASPAAATSGVFPGRDELTKAWGDEILGRLSARARSRYAAGRFLPSDGDRAVFALPGVPHRDQCLPMKPEVEAALAAHFGRPVPLDLVSEQAPSVEVEDDDTSFSVAELRDAPKATSTPADRVKSAFPGAEEVAP